MQKGIFASLLIIPIIVYGFLFSESVSVNQTAPESASPNSEFKVTVNINKDGITGFAKYQVKVPNGFVIEELESAEATFTFNKQEAKFIWLALPEQEVFTIAYKVIVSENAPENLRLNGSFSFLENNERQNVDANILNIAIKEGGNLTEEIAPPDPVVFVSREIKELGNHKYLVNLNITKKGIEGFAKIEEKLPEGAMAKDVVNKNKGVFTFLSNRAKYVWVSLPDEENFSVSYEIDLSSASDKTLLVNSGEFSYLHNNETAKINVLGPNTVESQEEQPALAENTPSESAPNEEIIEEVVKEAEPMAKKETPKKEKAKEPKAEKAPKTIANKQDVLADNNTRKAIPSPQNGIVYRVQISAGKRNVEKTYMSRVHNFDGEFFVENHEGWVKYTTGGFNQYKEARDMRNELTASYDFPGPFVAAYNGGERITVQEALMISNQQWLK